MPLPCRSRRASMVLDPTCGSALGAAWVNCSIHHHGAFFIGVGEWRDWLRTVIRRHDGRHWSKGYIGPRLFVDTKPPVRLGVPQDGAKTALLFRSPRRSNVTCDAFMRASSCWPAEASSHAPAGAMSTTYAMPIMSADLESATYSREKTPDKYTESRSLDSATHGGSDLRRLRTIKRSQRKTEGAVFMNDIRKWLDANLPDNRTSDLRANTASDEPLARATAVDDREPTITWNTSFSFEKPAGGVGSGGDGLTRLPRARINSGSWLAPSPRAGSSSAGGGSGHDRNLSDPEPASLSLPCPLTSGDGGGGGGRCGSMRPANASGDAADAAAVVTAAEVGGASPFSSSSLPGVGGQSLEKLCVDATIVGSRRWRLAMQPQASQGAGAHFQR